MTQSLSNITLPNVTYYMVPKLAEQFPDAELQVHGFIRNVVERLAKKKPDWMFTAKNPVKMYKKGADNAASTEFYLSFKDVEVTERGRYAGTIKSEEKHSYSRGIKTRVFGIASHTVKKQRGIKGVMYTASEDTAFKTALKKFGVKSDRVIMEEKVDEANKALASAAMTHSTHRILYSLSSERSKLGEHIIRYVMDREDDFLAHLPIPLHATFSGLGNAVHTVSIMDSVNRTNKSNITVYIFDGSWYVYNMAGTSDLSVFEADSDQIPEHIRLKVGMLKLIDSTHVIKDMGFKVNDNLYQVTPATVGTDNG